MFKTMKQIFLPTNKDLRKRIIYTLVALMIFVVGTSITIPGTSGITENLGFLELINAMGGGALKRFSIFALGVMPYITASIIIQLLQMDIVPYLAELSKQGQVGRNKINQITRYAGIVFAFIEGFAFSFAVIGKSGNTLDYLFIATILTAGTAFLLWMGDQITRKGIGNGISLIIMAGIISTLPTMFITAFKGFVFGEFSLWLGILLFVLFVIVYFLIVIGVIFVQEAERKIPIQYANKSTTIRGENQTFMPVKINSAGVIPVIFASSILAVPITIAQLINNEGFKTFVGKYLTYTKPVGFIIFVAFIFFFAYFYTFIQLKPEDLAKNLQNNGGYMPGVRPGKDTEKYISNILSKLTIVGALFLVVIAGIPILFSAVTKMDPSVTIGGTGLLIVVGVALETYKQLEGSLLTRNYKKGYSRR
ncbi:MAG: preprotein translocase subunit SecY [Bacilli bacterium]